mmetsp:Transcript_144606/g.463338  ORF Transcript_144606/g.463338 Transcript_144606/m.463338 type:complete len:244 (+) Transcript_144606:555-1286(+)
MPWPPVRRPKYASVWTPKRGAMQRRWWRQRVGRSGRCRPWARPCSAAHPRRRGRSWRWPRGSAAAARGSSWSGRLGWSATGAAPRPGSTARARKSGVHRRAAVRSAISASSTGPMAGSSTSRTSSGPASGFARAAGSVGGRSVGASSESWIGGSRTPYIRITARTRMSFHLWRTLPKIGMATIRCGTERGRTCPLGRLHIFLLSADSTPWKEQLPGRGACSCARKLSVPKWPTTPAAAVASFV